MNTFDLVERHHGVQLICHAIRHLLDHTPDEVDSGDVDAVDILQLAINPAESRPASSNKLIGGFTEVPPVRIPIAREGIVRCCKNGELDRTNGSVGTIVSGCPPVEPARREHPVSLLSLMEVLFHAIQYKFLGNSRPASHPLRTVR